MDYFPLSDEKNNLRLIIGERISKLQSLADKESVDEISESNLPNYNVFSYYGARFILETTSGNSYIFCGDPQNKSMVVHCMKRKISALEYLHEEQSSLEMTPIDSKDERYTRRFFRDALTESVANVKIIKITYPGRGGKRRNERGLELTFSSGKKIYLGWSLHGNGNGGGLGALSEDELSFPEGTSVSRLDV